MKKHLLLKYIFILSILLIGYNSFGQVNACIIKPSADTIICRGVKIDLTAANCLGNTTSAQELYSWVNLSNPGSPLSNKTITVSDT
jgi:hypothetical protein